MKTLALAVASVLTLAAPLAHAEREDYNPSYRNRTQYDSAAPAWRGDTRYDDDRYADEDRGSRWRDEHARVLESQPVSAAGQEECWNEQTRSYERRHIGAGTVIGAIAGGVIGHQFGSGHGNTAATAAGAIGGGLLGNRVDRNRADDEPSERTRCRTVSDNGSNDVVAYDVRYEYQGREYTTRLDHDPGRWLEVGRDIRADGYPLDSNVAESAAQPAYGHDWR